MSITRILENVAVSNPPQPTGTAYCKCRRQPGACAIQISLKFNQNGYARGHEPRRVKVEIAHRLSFAAPSR